MNSDETRVDLQRVESDQQDKGWRGRHVRPRRPFPWSVLVLLGAVVFILMGAGLLRIAWLQVYGHQEQTAANQNALENQWDRDPAIVSVPGATPDPEPTKNGGTWKPPPALAKLTIPNLKKTWYVVQGMTEASLQYAPSHYPKSALPGKTGNFAVAGHRQPGMFWDLDLVKAGQQIIVETHTTRYIYTVVKNFLVMPSDSYVVAPVPPGFNKGDKLLTLTTCYPKTGNSRRLIVQAQLTGTTKL